MSRIHACAWTALLLIATACGGDGGSEPPPPPDPDDDDPIRTTIVPTTNSGYVEARTSQIVTDGSPPSWVFDDFTFSSAATISTVQWQGIYCVQTPGAGAPAPTASSFTVTFYSDVSGRPNLAAPLQASTYTVAQAGQVFEKNVSDLFCGTAANTTWPFYRYEVTLSTPFSIAAGTKYWLSIQATTPSYAVYWGWRDGTPDNNVSLQLFENVYTTFPIDRAYALGS